MKTSIILLLLTICSFSPNQGALQYYKGSIGSVTQIQMSLELDETKVNGSFIYEESGEVFVLTGRIGKSSQSVVLDVINDRDVNVAQIQAHYYTNDLGEIMAIKGGFIDLATSQRKLVDLEKVAEFISKKKSKDSSHI